MLSTASSRAPAAGDVLTGASTPHVAGTILLQGAQPIALGVYERENKLFVSDNASGSLLMIDGATHQLVSSVPVGRDAFALVVNETAGKVYVGSDYAFAEGTGLISVLDANTGALITRIDPAPEHLGNPAGDFKLVDDEVHGKVWVSMFCPACNDLGVIDVRTDQFTPILQDVAPTFSHGFGVSGVNTRTNEVFAVSALNLYVIHGDTLGWETSPLPHAQPLSFAVNESQNKLYFWFNGGPYPSGVVVLDRNTGQEKVLEGAGDKEPLVFNESSDTLFSGAQVDTQGIVVSGATDQVTHVNFGAGGMGAGAVRFSTDNAYFASTDRTYVVNGTSKRVQRLETGHPTQGGIFAISVAIDQRRGLVYVVNDDHQGKIAVIEDGTVQAEQCVVPDVRGQLLLAAKRAIARANCKTGAIRRDYSARVKRGRVISQTPRPRTRLAKGARVNLVVSRGKRT